MAVIEPATSDVNLTPSSTADVSLSWLPTLGVLFQIVDDILDVTGSDEELGNPHGSDERHGKVTYVSLFGLGRARELAAESHANARAALAEVEGETADLALVTDFIRTRQA